MVMSHHMDAKIKVRGRFIQRTERKQTDATDCITFPANAVGIHVCPVNVTFESNRIFHFFSFPDENISPWP